MVFTMANPIEYDPDLSIVSMRSLADTDHESAHMLQYSPEHRYITEEGWMNALIMVEDQIAEPCTNKMLCGSRPPPNLKPTAALLFSKQILL
jgi:hypothetical protein